MSDEPQEIGERAFVFAVRVVKLCQALDALSKIKIRAAWLGRIRHPWKIDGQIHGWTARNLLFAGGS